MVPFDTEKFEEIGRRLSQAFKEADDLEFERLELVKSLIGVKSSL